MANNELDPGMAEAMKEDINKLIEMYGAGNIKNMLSNVEAPAVGGQSETIAAAPIVEPAKMPLNTELAEASAEKNKKRLAMFGDLRQALVDLGYDEIARPNYENPEDKTSDILLSVDTITRGELKVRVDMAGNVELSVNSTEPKFLNDLNSVRGKILVQNPDVRVSAKFLNGSEVTELNIDNRQNIVPEQVDGVAPKPINPTGENYSHDAKTGNWHVSPK